RSVRVRTSLLLFDGRAVPVCAYSSGTRLSIAPGAEPPREGSWTAQAVVSGLRGLDERLARVPERVRCRGGRPGPGRRSRPEPGGPSRGRRPAGRARRPPSPGGRRGPGPRPREPHGARPAPSATFE